MENTVAHGMNRKYTKPKDLTKCGSATILFININNQFITILQNYSQSLQHFRFYMPKRYYSFK